MALNFNEVLHPRTGLLVIRQTSLEPTLKILVGSAIMGMIIFFIVSTNTSSLMFEEGLNWAARLVPTTFLGIILLFGLALTVSGILQLIQPTEYQFDSHKKAYLKNGHIKATVDQLNGVGFSKRSTKEHSSYYQLFLDLKTGKQIKLMRTISFERAEELAQEINKMLDLPGTSSTFINKYAITFNRIFLAVFLLILIYAIVSDLMKSTYLPYSGREGEIKNRNLCLINIAFFCKGVLFYRKVNGKWRWHENGNEDYHAKYEGEIENGKPNGQGTETIPDGLKYVGGYKDGKKNGQGTGTWYNGDKYVGKWKDGEEHGQGTITYGKGKWEGDKYIGEYKYGKRHGQGTYTWSDGVKYVGEWKDGRPNGKGTWTYSSGWKYSGEMKNGEKWNGTTYDKEGKVVGNWVNGVEKKIP